CAICWNGTNVLMLPRCARAIETGYSVFASDIIHGHYLGDRRATQETRVFKYADKGFGILFLSRLLEETKVDFRKRYDLYQDEPLSKKYPVMTGKKAIMRIAYLARDYVHRFYIGPTEATPLTDLWGRLMDDDDPDEDDSASGKGVPQAEFTQING